MTPPFMMRLIMVINVLIAQVITAEPFLGQIQIFAGNFAPRGELLETNEIQELY